MVRRMYRVDVYLRVRRAVMVEGMSIRDVSGVFGLHRDTVRKILAYSVPPGPVQPRRCLSRPRSGPPEGEKRTGQKSCTGLRLI